MTGIAGQRLSIARVDNIISKGMSNLVLRRVTSGAESNFIYPVIQRTGRMCREMTFKTLSLFHRLAVS
jgi:hypothetical protein